MSRLWLEENKSLISSLAVSNLASLTLFILRFAASHNSRYSYLVWNLILAWLPVFFAYWFIKLWRRPKYDLRIVILLGMLWVGFLPNSFYLVSDLIHLYSTGEVSLLFDVTLFGSFIFNGYIAGYLSVYLVHKELKRRYKGVASYIIAAVLLLSSFAIYLGRNLRWNTWDIILHPAGLLFDVSDRIIDPVTHPQALVTTLTFFMLIGSIYWVIWEATQHLRRS